MVQLPKRRDFTTDEIAALFAVKGIDLTPKEAKANGITANASDIGYVLEGAGGVFVIAIIEEVAEAMNCEH